MNHVSAKISNIRQEFKEFKKHYIVMTNHYRSDELFFYSKELLLVRFDALLVS